MGWQCDNKPFCYQSIFLILSCSSPHFCMTDNMVIRLSCLLTDWQTRLAGNYRKNVGLACNLESWLQKLMCLNSLNQPFDVSLISIFKFFVLIYQAIVFNPLIVDLLAITLGGTVKTGISLVVIWTQIRWVGMMPWPIAIHQRWKNKQTSTRSFWYVLHWSMQRTLET